MNIRPTLLILCLLNASWLWAKDPVATPVAPPVYLHPELLRIEQILPPPPPPGSEQEKADHAQFDQTRARRTYKDVQRSKQEETDSVFLFADSLGCDFNEANLPKTAALFAQVTLDAKASVKVAKNFFKRARPETPEVAEEALAEPGPPDYAFPSGHSTRAFVWAVLLTDLFPEHSQALLQQARQLAWDRVVLGKHFPTDVVAGRAYGQFLATELLMDASFQKEWKAVVKEVQKFKARSAGKTHG